MSGSESLPPTGSPISIDTMRGHFERMIKDTPRFRDSTPLEIFKVNGAFSHYFNPDTDTMWIGFALGMRMAERLANAAAHGGDGRSLP